MILRTVVFLYDMAKKLVVTRLCKIEINTELLAHDILLRACALIWPPVVSYLRPCRYMLLLFSAVRRCRFRWFVLLPGGVRMRQPRRLLRTGEYFILTRCHIQTCIS